MAPIISRGFRDPDTRGIIAAWNVQQPVTGTGIYLRSYSIRVFSQGVSRDAWEKNRFPGGDCPTPYPVRYAAKIQTGKGFLSWDERF